MTDDQHRTSDLDRAEAAVEDLLARLPEPSHHMVYDGVRVYIDVHLHDADAFHQWSGALERVNDHAGFELRDMAAWHTGYYAGFRVDLWLHGVTGGDFITEDVEAVAA